MTKIKGVAKKDKIHPKHVEPDKLPVPSSPPPPPPPYTPRSIQPATQALPTVIQVDDNANGTGTVTGSALWYVLSILSTIFCCLPCGAIGLAHVIIAKHEGEKGNAEGYMRRMRQGKCWTAWSIAAGLTLILVLLVGHIVICGSNGWTNTQTNKNMETLAKANAYNFVKNKPVSTTDLPEQDDENPKQGNAHQELQSTEKPGSSSKKQRLIESTTRFDEPKQSTGKETTSRITVRYSSKESNTKTYDPKQSESHHYVQPTEQPKYGTPQELKPTERPGNSEYSEKHRHIESTKKPEEPKQSALKETSSRVASHYSKTESNTKAYEPKHSENHQYVKPTEQPRFSTTKDKMREDSVEDGGGDDREQENKGESSEENISEQDDEQENTKDSTERDSSEQEGSGMDGEYDESERNSSRERHGERSREDTWGGHRGGRRGHGEGRGGRGRGGRGGGRGRGRGGGGRGGRGR